MVDSPKLDRQFLRFIQQRNLDMRANDKIPKSKAEWEKDKQQLRRRLIKSWGGFPKEPCDLEPRVLGTFKRDGYRVERLLLQTRPGIQMTANAYVPDGSGKRAAVLCVHGHWRLAKSEPRVQARCIGLAKLGFFVLMVDAFGAGERGLKPALGEYHGEMVGATLLPAGLPLSGLQVYENMRAVDYMISRPEVDADRIGITGCSGGGNQTMYAGAFDERHKAVVPVCSVGTYQAYLGAACCMCEVVPAAMSYTEEWQVLSLVAPRALMVVNATRDGFQFSIGEARKSLAKARQIFDLYDSRQNAVHATFESVHDYNQSMREAMYGFMTWHLKGARNGNPPGGNPAIKADLPERNGNPPDGNPAIKADLPERYSGKPIKEPHIDPEEVETVRCFPGDSRPKTFVTLPQFAAAESQKILAQRTIPKHAEQWESDELMMRESLPRVLGATSSLSKNKPENVEFHKVDDHTRPLQFASNISGSGKTRQVTTIFATQTNPKLRTTKRVLLLDLDRGREAVQSGFGKQLLSDGWQVVTADLRATGMTKNSRDGIGRAVDHNSAEWSLWIGRPLLGQWLQDVQRLLDVLASDLNENDAKHGWSMVAHGTASLVGLVTAALDERINQVVTINGLASFVSSVPYEKQRLGLLVPGILRSVGDIQHIASLVAPRPLTVAGAVHGNGKRLSRIQLNKNFDYTRAVFDFQKQAKHLSIDTELSDKQIIEVLNANV